MLQSYKSIDQYARSHYRPEIDGLRAIAVIAVILNHFDKELFPGAYLGVDIFFVISGYVITSSLLSKPPESFLQFINAFYARRFKRLLPALAACIVVTGLLAILFINASSPQLSVILNTGVFALFGVTNVFLFRNHIDYFGFQAELNPFMHTWSLGVEEQFYFFYPAILWISIGGRPSHILRNLLASVAILSLLSFAYFAWMDSRLPEAAYYLMPARFWELGAGCIAFVLHRGFAHPRTKRLSGAVSAAASIAVMVTIFFPSGGAFAPTVAAVASAALLLLFLAPGSLAFAALSLRPVVFLGTISYSLYLWHWPVLAISRWTTGTGLAAQPFQLGMISLLSVASFFAIEAPLRRALWFGSNGRTVLAGFLLMGASFGCMIALRDNLAKSWRLGKPAQLAERRIDTDRILGGRVVWNVRDCVYAGKKDAGKNFDANACTVNDAKGATRRLLVIGNSFSAAEFDMLTAAPEAGLGSVTITSSWGAPETPELLDATHGAAAKYYWAFVIPKLMSELQKGDVLIMINDVADLLPAERSEESAARLGKLQEGLSRIAQDMEAKGVSILFQTGNPFMREARCTPDMSISQWYRFGAKTSCRYFTRDYTIARRAPMQSVLEKLRAKHKNFFVLDLMDVFCPERLCTFNGANGEILYRDENSHPSLEANYLARPVFLRTVKQIADETAPDKTEWPGR